jgi:hypothetical protein
MGRYAGSHNNLRGGGGGGGGGGRDVGMGAWITRQDPVTGATFYYNTVRSSCYVGFFLLVFTLFNVRSAIPC